jgi:hypothetical protein
VIRGCVSGATDWTGSAVTRNILVLREFQLTRTWTLRIATALNLCCKSLRCTESIIGGCAQGGIVEDTPHGGRLRRLTQVLRQHFQSVVGIRGIVDGWGTVQAIVHKPRPPARMRGFRPERGIGGDTGDVEVFENALCFAAEPTEMPWLTHDTAWETCAQRREERSGNLPVKSQTRRQLNEEGT